MRLSLSRSQIEQLGKRLVLGPEPDPDDLEALHGLLRGYGEVLGEAVATVREQTGFAPTARVKNTGTILEKLDRYGGSWLKSLQDLAGMRIAATSTAMAKTPWSSSSFAHSMMRRDSRRSSTGAPSRCRVTGPCT